MQDDPNREGLCIHCNKCMPTIYTGTRCVIV
jgi:4,4'-dithiodibutanoate disulfide reductase